VFIRTYRNPTYNFNEVDAGKANGKAPVEEHKYFKVSEATDISEKLIALILGFKSGHDNEENENGSVANTADSRTSQHTDDGRVVDVTSVVVLPEFRKSSVGTTLFKDYIQRLATVGVADRIRVRVPADTGVAEFFERLEFEKRGDKTQDGFLVLENTIEEDDDSIEHEQEDY
jgi:GNAT superfamily N-acetyltransferase